MGNDNRTEKLKITIQIPLLVLLFFSCSSSDNEGELTPEPISDIEKIQQIADSKVGGGDNLLGVSISVRIGENPSMNVTAGLSKPGEEISENMIFGVGSITKTAVSAAILILEEEGVLSLDDTIQDWVSIDNQNIEPSVTIFQLLNHQSGIRNYFADPSFWPTIESDFSQGFPSEDLLTYVGEPVGPPGTFSYSNTNYILLGLVIKNATGKDVGEYLREKFWSPFQLVNIYFGSDEELNSLVANPWRDYNGDGVQEDISSRWGAAYHSAFYTAADIFSTASDLSRWGQLLFQGKVVNQESLNKMTSFIAYDTGDPLDGNGYGLGVTRMELNGKEYWGHAGGMRGYGSNFLFHEPNEDFTVAILINQSLGKNDFELTNEILTEILEL